MKKILMLKQFESDSKNLRNILTSPVIAREQIFKKTQYAIFSMGFHWLVPIIHHSK
jgi:hypothetical protein